MPETVLINSLQELEDFTKRIFEDITLIENKEIRFSESIPKTVRIKVTGEKFHSSLPTSFMQGIIELQKGINHTYALLKYGDKGKRLTAEDLAATEITVTVKDGSSLLDIDWYNAIAGLTQNMTGTQMIIMGSILVGGLLVSQFMKLKFNSNKEERDQEYEKLRLQETTRVLESQQKQNIEAIKAVLEIVSDTQKAAYGKIAKSAETIEVEGGERVTSVELKEEVKQERRREQPQMSTHEGDFSLHALHFAESDTSVDLVDLNTGQSFKNVRLQDIIISESDFQIIQNAIDRQPLHLRIIITKKNGKVTDAAIDSILD